MNEIQMLQIIEEYLSKGNTQFGEIKVTYVPDQKNVFVEQNGDMDRPIVMNQYKAEGTTYWAGYSSRSETVYVSLAC